MLIVRTQLEPPPSGKKATASNVSTVKDAEVSVGVCVLYRGFAYVSFLYTYLWLLADSLENLLTVTMNGKSIRLRLKSSKDETLTYSDLLYEIRSVLDLWKGKIWLILPDGTRFHPNTPLEELCGQTVTLVV
ncbi:unnamed protein product [Cylicostephanus goldi]|uniref:Uncharacterized protein n=1 Tax=Cylicostephanus goldi TaxID=71465 RepID=A0A3P6T2E9_CYLGO|nr:unnamed protein product [Cylicostephanus goldi]